MRKTPAPKRLSYGDWIKTFYKGKPGTVHTEYVEIGAWLEDYASATYAGVRRTKGRRYLRYTVPDLAVAFNLMREALFVARAKRWSLTPA